MPTRPVLRPPSWPLLYLATALTTAAALMLRFALARIVTVVAGEPVALHTVTAAMLGLVLGGLLAYRLPVEAAGCCSRLGAISLFTSCLGALSVMTATSRGIGLGTLPYGVLYVAAALPFIATGIVLAMAVAMGVQRVGSVFAFGLLGLGGGGVGLVALLHGIGAPNAVLASSVVFAAAGAIWFSLAGKRMGRILGVTTGLFFTLLVMVNAGFHLIDVRYARGSGLAEKGFVKWNSYSRVSLTAGTGGSTLISVDAKPGMPIASESELKRRGAGIGPVLRPGAKTLVVEPGGGVEVAQALASGSTDVTGVEVNSIIGKTIMQRRFAALSDRLYLRPGVHIYIEEGLSFLRRTPAKYGVIHLNKGPENGDEFREYLAHLTADGVLVVASPIHAAPPPELHTVTAGGALIVARQPIAAGEIAKVAEEFSAVVQPPMMDRNVLIVSGAAALLVLLGLATTARRGALVPVLCTLVIGVAYIMVTISLTRSLALFLGHPTYGFTIVLFTFLLATGVGSFQSARRVQSVNLIVIVACVAGLAGAGAFLLPALLSSFAAQALPVRLLITVAFLVPAGFVWGLVLPAGFRVLADRDDGLVRGAWSLFVAASVLGFTLAAGV